MNTVYPKEVMEAFNIRHHPGYLGAFTTDQAAGAWPNGTRVVKVSSDDEDVTPPGTLGIVLGSMHTDNIPYFYFIEWDDKPKIAVGCVEMKLRARP